MFPLLGLRLTGLQPDHVYDVMVDLVPVNCFRHRYVYHRSRWTTNSDSFDDGVLQATPCCQHPSSLTQLRETTITFDKLKLTNNPGNGNKHVRILSCLSYCFCSNVVLAKQKTRNYGQERKVLKYCLLLLIINRCKCKTDRGTGTTRTAAY